ncbi:MAG: hypothetical protein IJ004_05155 [Clostridia bacterium]|nr:hypothetical protein [Clostridia bacterium]
MEIFKGLIGNEEIKSSLGRAILDKRFSHAYIIEGAYGTGKHTIARLASASILCKNKGGKALPCGICDTCQKILSDNCTDVRFFDAFKIDDVRKIKENLYDSATECEYKIYILNDVQKMNIKAQNALLISLEEPPPHVLFFLLTTDSSYLVETIRSRAQILRTKPLDKDTIFNYVRKNCKTSLSDEALCELIVASSGSLGYVLDMLDEKKSQALLKDRERTISLISAYLNDNAESISTIASLFSLQRDKLKELLQLCLVAIRDLAVTKKHRGASLCFFSSLDDALSVASKHSLQKILGLYEAIERALLELDANVSVSNTLVSILIKKGK